MKLFTVWQGALVCVLIEVFMFAFVRVHARVSSWQNVVLETLTVDLSQYLAVWKMFTCISVYLSVCVQTLSIL